MSHARSTEGAAIYRKAAKMMEEEVAYCDGRPVRFACYALELAEFGHAIPSHSTYCHPMKAVFAPESMDGAWLYDASCSQEANTDLRILALCFMAAMVEAGDA